MTFASIEKSVGLLLLSSDRDFFKKGGLTQKFLFFFKKVPFPILLVWGQTIKI